MQASIRGVSNNRQLESSLCTTNDDCTDNQWCATTNVENVSTCQDYALNGEPCEPRILPPYHNKMCDPSTHRCYMPDRCRSDDDVVDVLGTCQELAILSKENDCCVEGEECESGICVSDDGNEMNSVCKSISALPQDKDEAPILPVEEHDVSFEQESQVENEAEENNVDEHADTAEENNAIADTAGQNSVQGASNDEADELNENADTSKENDAVNDAADQSSVSPAIADTAGQNSVQDANNDEADEVNENADTSKENDAVNDAADPSSVSPANNDETNEIDEVLNSEPEMDHNGNLNATENVAELTPNSNSSSSDPTLEDEGDITTNIHNVDDRPYDHEHSQPHDKTITKNDRSHSNTNSTQQQQKQQPQQHHRPGCTSNVPTLKCKIWDFLDTPPSQYDAHQTISGVVFLAITFFLFAYIIKRRVCPTNPNNGTSRDKKRRYLNADEYAMIAAEYDELLEGAFDHDCDQLTQYDDDDSDEESLQSILSEWSGDGGENDGIEMGDVLGGRV